MADPASFLPEGRSVRCANCGHKWFQRPPEGARAAGPADAADGLDAARAAAAEIVDAYAPPETPVAARAAKADMEKLDALRAKAQTRIAGGEKGTARAAWAALAASLVGAAALVDLFRVEIVRAWPQAASLYALYGRELNVRGFEFVGVTHRVTMLDGAPVIEVTGRLRNVADEPRIAPPLRAGFSNAEGAETAAWTIRPASEPVAPGETLEFFGRGPATPDIASLELRFVKKGD
ncbi:MAG: hypothetical protein Tsb0010_18290 [Parvularculaceae bacterium]